METFQEHYLSMKRTIAARKLNVDMALIDRAVDYAREKHKDQKRKDGSPYIIHPLAVAEIVAEIGLDTDAILGALLHDCIEDTDSTYDDIARNFGPTVASLDARAVRGQRLRHADPRGLFRCGAHRIAVYRAHGRHQQCPVLLHGAEHRRGEAGAA